MAPLINRSTCIFVMPKMEITLSALETTRNTCLRKVLGSQVVRIVENCSTVSEIPIMLDLVFLEVFTGHFFNRANLKFHFTKITLFTRSLPDEDAFVWNVVTVVVLHNVLFPFDTMQHQALILAQLFGATFNHDHIAIAEKHHAARQIKLLCIRLYFELF